MIKIKFRKFAAQLVKISLIMSLVFCSLTESRKGPVDRSDYPLKVSQIKGPIYLVEDGNYWKTNTIFYADDNSILFVNATYLPKTAERVIWKAMSSGYGEFKGVLLTSYRIHHTGGLLAFYNRDIPSLANYRTDMTMRARWPFMLADMNYFQSWIDPPRMEISRRYRLEPGDRKWLIEGVAQIIYPGPAHTNDNIAIYFPKQKLLYAGSMLSDPLFFTDKMNVAGMKKAIQQFEKLDIETVVCGHGEPFCDRSIFNRVKQQIAEISK